MSGSVWCGKSLTVPWILTDYATTRKRQHESLSHGESTKSGSGGSVKR